MILGKIYRILGERSYPYLRDARFMQHEVIYGSCRFLVEIIIVTVILQFGIVKFYILP